VQGVAIFNEGSLSLNQCTLSNNLALDGNGGSGNSEFGGGGEVDRNGKGGPNGGGPQVNIFDGSSHALIQSFYAFDPAFRGGVFVAIGDLFSDGTLDIITGAGACSAPQD
jgi:hypothetical protein